MPEQRKTPAHDGNKDVYAVVGELVLISSAIDHVLNRALITVLDLGEGPWVESIIATLDTNRKVEILKARAGHMSSGDWKKGVTKFCDKVESVFAQRNIACHTPPVLEGDVWTFKPVAAAKMLKNLDLTAKRLRPFSVNNLKTAIRTGEAALGAGMNLIDNFTRVNAKIKQRRATKDAPADASGSGS